ncbi:28S ribosomal protein S21, mitochondrial isoform X1 [Hemicordylus capensis]|uniref:28S ribosomal protein S21, mitochondrial isoform X1 n=1 Tax=Hemicordylus capensis TaxID=884348 RepID=UPI0023038957|nr:28S ribosomal protein S21, mitochondrial isoform X1 [Hemicordylus capensis]
MQEHRGDEPKLGPSLPVAVVTKIRPQAGEGRTNEKREAVGHRFPFPVALPSRFRYSQRRRPGGVLTMDGIVEEVKRRRYYEKPCRKRQRVAYETCRRIYNMEMARKISFLMRKNRVDPWLGC